MSHQRAFHDIARRSSDVLVMYSLVDDAPVSAYGVMKSIGVSHTTARKSLKYLESSGLVNHTTKTTDGGREKKLYRPISEPLLSAESPIDGTVPEWLQTDGYIYTDVAVALYIADHPGSAKRDIVSGTMYSKRTVLSALNRLEDDLEEGIHPADARLTLYYLSGDKPPETYSPGTSRSES